MCQNSHFPIFNHARGWLSNFNHARGWEMTMRQKLTMCVVEFLAHCHVRVRECARTGTFLLLLRIDLLNDWSIEADRPI